MLTKGQPIYNVELCSNGAYTIDKYIRTNKYIEHPLYGIVNCITEYDRIWKSAVETRRNGIWNTGKGFCCIREHAILLIQLNKHKLDMSCATTFNWENMKSLSSSEVQKQAKNQADESRTWRCIDNYLKSQGFFKLLDGSDGTRKWKYTPTNFKENGKSTFIVYFQDGKVELRYQDGNKMVDGYTGTWKCGTDDKSYIIRWDDGEVHKYGN